MRQLVYEFSECKAMSSTFGTSVPISIFNYSSLAGTLAHANFGELAQGLARLLLPARRFTWQNVRNLDLGQSPNKNWPGSLLFIRPYGWLIAGKLRAFRLDKAKP